MLLLAEPILRRFYPSPPASKTLAIVLVGHDPASERYVALKQTKAADYGVTTRLFRLEPTASEAAIIDQVAALNHDPTIDALIVQLPLPTGCRTKVILDAIDPAKDVDDLTRTGRFVSPMVQAVAALFSTYQLSLANKTVVVVGRGRLIGRPVAAWLEKQGRRPARIGRTTASADAIIRESDIVIAGTGATNVINASNTRPDQVIIDCTGRDVDFAAVAEKVAAISPPRGGIGPLTVHFLLSNVLLAPRVNPAHLALRPAVGYAQDDDPAR